MAGRYVILEFDDRDAAEAFVTNPHIPQQLGYSVTAMFLKPKAFCSCPDKLRQNNKNWAKNKRYGLYICLNCRKPSIFHERGIMDRLKYVFGYNLMGKS